MTPYPQLPPCLIKAALTCFILSVFSQALLKAAAAYADSSSPSDKFIYVDKYALCTNVWGINGSGPEWYEYLFTNSTTSINGSGYKWTGFTNATHTGVKSYPSIRTGITNSQNNIATSGLPYQFGNNTKNVDVLWSFTATDYNGTGSVQGAYNHTLDVFFSRTSDFRLVNRSAEVMVITSSSANSQTQGWGTKDSAVYYDPYGLQWDVWQATMSVGGYSWPVMQFRKRTNSTYLNYNLKAFFAEAARRRPDVFKSSDYVMMVEAGTEVKSGSGKVYNQIFSVNVY